MLGLIAAFAAALAATTPQPDADNTLSPVDVPGTTYSGVQMERPDRDPAKVVFSGAGKRDEEIRYALERGIHSFNCESEQELERISAAAALLRVKPKVALRVNPDVNAETHPYISTGLREHKFGISITEVEEVYEAARRLPNLDVDGVSCHIGSQLLDMAPVMEAVDRLLSLVERLRRRGFAIRTLDLGGGLGVAYRPGEEAPGIAGFVREVCAKAAGHGLTPSLPRFPRARPEGLCFRRPSLAGSRGGFVWACSCGALRPIERPSGRARGRR